jgi:hypothetical protein
MNERLKLSTTSEGGCLCGDLRYRVRGAPVLRVICYCTFCQRATGSSHLDEPFWKAGQFEMIRGEPSTFETTSRGSGKRITISFCASCGTKLFQAFARFPGMVAVYGGTLDQPGLAAEAPQTWRLFLDDAPAGTVISAGVDVWPQHRLDAEGNARKAIVFSEWHVTP